MKLDTDASLSQESDEGSLLSSDESDSQALATVCSRGDAHAIGFDSWPALEDFLLFY